MSKGFPELRTPKSTHEQLNLQRKNKFIIPNVCQDFGVRWVDTFQVLDATAARFDLRPLTQG